MSNTKHVMDSLSAYLDGELNKAERARVEAHLRTCVQCQHELESLRYTIRMVQELPIMRAPRAFTLSAEQAAQLRPWWQAGWFANTLRGMTALAALLLVLVISADVLFFNSADLTRQSTPAPMAAKNEPTQAGA